MALGQEEIGSQIRKARKEKGWSQRELAERIGVQDAQSVSRYERGETEVTTKRLQRIAEATGKPMSFFCLDPAEERAVSKNGADTLEALVVRLEAAVNRLEGQGAPEVARVEEAVPAAPLAGEADIRSAVARRTRRKAS